MAKKRINSIVGDTDWSSLFDDYYIPTHSYPRGTYEDVWNEYTRYSIRNGGLRQLKHEENIFSFFEDIPRPRATTVYSDNDSSVIQIDSDNTED